MVSNQSNNVVLHHPKQHIYQSDKMYPHISSSLMSSDGSMNKPAADIKELIPPPIIREEDLKRMNELSKEAGWSVQGEIDYKYIVLLNNNFYINQYLMFVLSKQ